MSKGHGPAVSRNGRAGSNYIVRFFTAATAFFVGGGAYAGAGKPASKASSAPAEDRSQSKLGKADTSSAVSFSFIRDAVGHCMNLPRSVLISSLFINLLGLALPLAILQVYDRILPNRAIDTLTMLVIGLAVVVLVEGAMKIARSEVMSWSALKTGYATDVDIVHRLLRARRSDFSQDGTAVWIERLDALTQLNNFYGGPSRLILLDLPFVAIFLAFIALVGGWLVLVPIAVIICFAVLAMKRGQKLQKLYLERTQQDSRRYDFIVECLRGIHAIKSMAMEPAMQRRFERLQRSSATISYQLILHSNAMQTAGALFANVAMICMVTIGAVAVMGGHMSVGVLACCSLLSGRVVQPVLKGISVWSELQTVAINQKRAEPLLALPVVEPAGNTAGEINGSLRLNDVCLGRRDGGGQLFEHLSMQVEAGRFAGLRGADGSGRTTLMNMLRGDVLPDSGQLYLDGYNVTGRAQGVFAQSVCFVGAGAPIFRGSVIDNITMFRRGEVMERARQSARLIGLEDDIHALPEGYDTIIGEGVADTLPGGLQQRIAIARVLVRAPRILLFDEANSLVDFESDAKLREGLSRLKGHMTVVIASNRPSFLAICDDIYELRNGQLESVLPNGDRVAVSGENSLLSPRLPAGGGPGNLPKTGRQAG